MDGTLSAGMLVASTVWGAFMLLPILLAASVASTPAATLPADQVAQIKSVMVMSLRDYDSTKVMRAFAYHRSYAGYNWNAMCVLANTKNGAGGYIGYHWYSVQMYPATPLHGVVPSLDADSGCEHETPMDAHDYTGEIAPKG
jgi:hypothetical protein